MKKALFALFLVASLAMPVVGHASGEAIQTLAATGVTETQATLNGFYNAGTSANVSVRFEWGETPLMGQATTYQVKTGSGAYSATIAVTTGKQYYFRAMLAGTGINPIWGSALSFSTINSNLPTVQNLAATNVSETSATLNAFWNGNGASTQTRFEYANNSSFIGSAYTSWTTQSSASGTMSENISGLTDNTSYYFRAYAKNSAGTQMASGSLSFMTDDNGGPNPDACVIDSFTADDYSFDEPGEPELNWSTSNCDDVSITHIGSVGTDGSYTDDEIDEDTTYTISASNSTSSDSDSLTITVDEDDNGNEDDCEITEFYASDTHIDDGDSTTIHWDTDNCDHVTLTGFGEENDHGSKSVSPNDTEDYTLRAYDDNDDLQDDDEITIYVNDDDEDDPYYPPVPPYYPPIDYGGVIPPVNYIYTTDYTGNGGYVLDYDNDNMIDEDEWRSQTAGVYNTGFGVSALGILFVILLILGIVWIAREYRN